MKNKHTLIEGRKVLDNNYDHKHHKPSNKCTERLNSSDVLNKLLDKMIRDNQKLTGVTNEEIMSGFCRYY